MEEGEELLVELRRSGWVDPAVDWETLRAGLAEGRSAGQILARDRDNATLFVQYEPDDLRLLGEMTAIARRPYVDADWPALPEVDIDRISADFARTTGRDLHLELRWEQFPGRGYWVCVVSIDGRNAGSIGIARADQDPEQLLVDLADGLCERYLHEEVWGGWPRCARHPSRPMWAGKDDRGRAAWICEAVAADQAEIGLLGT